MSFEAVQTRWDAFLSKIKSKFEEMMDKSEAGMPMIFDNADLDTTPFSVAWQGIDMQTKNLIWKIDETWSNQVDEAFENTGIDIDSPEYIEERNKGYILTHQLEMALHTTKVRIFAKAAHQLIGEVKSILTGRFVCTQCNAQLPVKDNFFRSYYTTCEYCKTVNTFEPGSKARNIEHFAANAIGDEASLGHYITYENAKFQNYLQDEKVYKKKQLAELYRNYIEVFLKKRIELVPEYQEKYEKDLESKMTFVTKY